MKLAPFVCCASSRTEDQTPLGSSHWTETSVVLLVPVTSATTFVNAAGPPVQIVPVGLRDLRDAGDVGRRQAGIELVGAELQADAVTRKHCQSEIVTGDGASGVAHHHGIAARIAQLRGVQS